MLKMLKMKKMKMGECKVLGKRRLMNVRKISVFERLEIGIRIVQAPMAGVSTPEMAANVSNAGALGSISIGATDVAVSREMIRKTQGLTARPFNVNVFCHQPARVDHRRESDWIGALRPTFEKFESDVPSKLKSVYLSFVEDNEKFELIMELRPRVVSFHFGLPNKEWIDAMKSAGIVLLSTATSVKDALMMQGNGIDAIVAQGYEAGGHRGIVDPFSHDDKLSTMALTELLVSKLNIPVISAGGIMDGVGISKALSIGADGVQLGTAFIVCPETSIDSYYRKALLSKRVNHTVMTNAISGRPARCIENEFTKLDRDILYRLNPPDYPIAYHAGKVLHSSAKNKGEGGYGAQWAGEGVSQLRQITSTELVKTLQKEIDEQNRIDVCKRLALYQSYLT